MDNQLIKKIVADKIHCYFVSPHLDDAVFSAGGLIAYLSRYTQVEIVTVFTRASPRPYTLSAKAFLNQCAYTDADVLFEDRRSEDVGALTLVGIKPQHLVYVDALWRKISAPGLLRRMLSNVLPESLHAYPTYRLHIIRGGISRHDTPLLHTLSEELKKIVDTDKEYVLFCPLALRSHIDHVFVRDVCLANFDNVIMWRDFPYNMENGLSAGEIGALGDEAFRWDAEKEVKKKMMESYTSQTRAMFPDGNIPLVPEVYYSLRKKSSRI